MLPGWHSGRVGGRTHQADAVQAARRAAASRRKARAAARARLVEGAHAGRTPAWRVRCVLLCCIVAFGIASVLGSALLLVFVANTDINLSDGLSQEAASAHPWHLATSQLSVWTEYLQTINGLGLVLPECSFRIQPTLVRNKTDAVYIVWETNVCHSIPHVRWRRLVDTRLRTAAWHHAARNRNFTGVSLSGGRQREWQGLRDGHHPTHTGDDAQFGRDPGYEAPSVVNGCIGKLVRADAATVGGRQVYWCELERLAAGGVYEYQVRMLPAAWAGKLVDVPDDIAVRVSPAHVFRHVSHEIVPQDLHQRHLATLASLHHTETEEDVVAVVVGDSQSGSPVFRHHVLHMSSHQPDVLVHIGDTVQSPRVQREWHAYLFGPLEEANVGAKAPLMLVRGNHDGPGNGAVGSYSPTPPYALTLGSVRLVVIDAELDTARQERWLRAELKSRASLAAAFVVVATHIPPFVEWWEPEAWERGEKEWGAFVRRKYVPLFEAMGVDLVIGGHSHIYQRGALNGVHYLVVGGGGAALEDIRVADYGVYSVTNAVHHYGVLRTEGRCALDWTVYDGNDRLFDELRLVKPC